MEKIWLSVIIPVYNVEKYLRECLDSVLSQDVRDMEIICVNDGSTDNSGRILAEYAQKDNRIVIINRENGGMSIARNTGIDHAKGEYITFLDSDDIYEEGVLVKIRETLEESDLQVLCYDAKCFYEDEALKRKEYKDEHYRRKKSYGGPYTGKELFCQFIENDDLSDVAWALAINRQWLNENNIRFEPGIIYEDCLFTFQYMMCVEKMAHIKLDVVKYRIRYESIMTSKVTCEKLRSRIFCIEKVLEYIYTNTLNSREKNAVCKFLKFLVYNVRYIEMSLDEKERKKISELTGMAGFWADTLCMDKAIVSDNQKLADFDKKLENATDIIIYGAGKIGNILYRYIERLHLEGKVRRFVVSGQVETDKKLNGISICSIEDIDEKKDILLAIAARSDYQEDMAVKAKNLGFEEIIRIDYQLERLIGEALD